MYRGRLQTDFALWVEKGLVSREAADSMLQEYDQRPQSFTIGRVLMMLATLLIAAALVLLVAANWDGIPRELRSSMLIGLIWLCFGAASYMGAKGGRYITGALLVLGATAFGTSIALIGQMYNLSGDGTSATALWFVMTLIAAILYRSEALTYYTGALGWFFLSILISEGLGSMDSRWFFAPPVMAAAVIGLLYYTGAGRARHLAYTLLLGWLGWLYIDRGMVISPWLYVGLGLVGLLLSTLPVSPLREMARRAGASPAFYSLLLACLGLLIFQFEQTERLGYDASVLQTAFPALLMIALSVLALVLDGRDNAAVRYTSYAVFAAEVLYLSVEVAGSMLGTSGVFLFTGLILAVIAWFVIRVEKRFAANQQELGVRS